MHVGAFNGTRVGALVQTLLYLTGVPNLFNKHYDQVSKNDGGRSSFSLEELDPKPYPEDPSHTQCYGILGCFQIKYAEQRGFHLFPSPIKNIKPEICLQIYQNRTCQPVDQDTVPFLKVSPGNKSYWITHGYIDTGHKPWTQKMSDELLEYDNTSNVYIIDWGLGAQPPYSQAAVNVELLGAYVGHLMILLQDTYSLPINGTHFIGHSLGAHFGGFVGSWLSERGFHLARISGLDPAQPYFQEFPPDVKLDPSDALFVDVIHTDAKPLLDGGSLSGLGTQEPSGHADFFPNSGKNQPGCTDGVYQAILQEKGSFIYGLRRFFSCDHIRSYEYFTESIRSPCRFLSFSCSSWDAFLTGSCTPACDSDDTGENCNRMGFHARKPAQTGASQAVKESEDENELSLHQTSARVTSRIYFSITGNRSPYCREHYRVKLDIGTKSTFRTKSDLNLLILGQEGVLDKVKLWAKGLSDSVSFQYVVPGHGFRAQVEKMLLKPTSSNALWWLVGKVVPQPEIQVDSVSLLSMERNSNIVLCPAGAPFLRMSEESNNVLLTAAACNHSSSSSTSVNSFLPNRNSSVIRK